MLVNYRSHVYLIIPRIYADRRIVEHCNSFIELRRYLMKNAWFAKWAVHFRLCYTVMDHGLMERLTEIRETKAIISAYFLRYDWCFPRLKLSITSQMLVQMQHYWFRHINCHSLSCCITLPHWGRAYVFNISVQRVLESYLLISVCRLSYLVLSLLIFEMLFEGGI